ncbi:MAG: malectin domain-containing carbohydrate-binding protein [Kiritimatiellia bacterium]
MTTDPGLAGEQYRLRTNGSTLTISGGGDLAVLYGAYAFAEKLGVRFQLDGDVVPDERMPFALPVLDETAQPAFATRGLLPFHDFPEGPDLWTADDCKQVLSQMVKLRMNFIGLHTYTECGWGSEPTVWLGLPEDVGGDGRPRFSYPAHYFNTARNASGHAPRKVEDMVFGGSLLFESDPWGSPVMSGLMPQGRTTEECNEVFARTGALLREAFTYARRFGITTCAGTEIPLTHPNRLLPHALREHLKEKGLSAADPATRRALYAGTFLRAMRAYPLDYYWLWTPEAWRGPQSDADVEQTRLDLLAAVEAAREVKAPFTLATAGWVLGPARDRAMFDKLLPPQMPFAALNRELGTVPVDEGFARLGGRAGWAIPWLEDDLGMSSPQLWVGRVLRDAYDAKRHGCSGLIGIHWRTEEIGPMVAALARAQWRVPEVSASSGPTAAIRVEGGATASFGAPVEGTDLDPVYQTVRYDVAAYDLAVTNGRHRVTLQFNEPFYDAPGKRVFGVAIQGRPVVDRLDVFARAGRNHALDLVFDDVEVADGRLKISFMKDVSSQLIGADREEALGRYIEFPCIAGIVVEGRGTVLKINCGGPAWRDYAADPGQPAIPRFLPPGDIYLDWARAQFGAEAAEEIAAIHSRIDGHLPSPAPHCPGGIAVNGAPWSAARGAYTFVDELAALQPRIRGAGNRARFANRLKSFEYLRAIGRVACTRGELDRVIAAMNAKTNAANARRSPGRRAPRAGRAGGRLGNDGDPLSGDGRHLGFDRPRAHPRDVPTASCACWRGMMRPSARPWAGSCPRSPGAIRGNRASSCPPAGACCRPGGADRSRHPAGQPAAQVRGHALANARARGMVGCPAAPARPGRSHRRPLPGRGDDVGVSPRCRDPPRAPTSSGPPPLRG